MIRVPEKSELGQEDRNRQERQAILDRFRTRLTDEVYTNLCSSGPFFTVEQRALLQNIGVPQNDIGRLFPQLPAEGQEVLISQHPETDRRIE